MPQSKLGTLCCRLGIGSLGAFGAFYALVASGQRGGDTFFSNPWLTWPMLTAVGLAIGGAATGLVAVVRDAERAWTVFLVIGFGLLIAAFGASELLAPH